MAYWIERDMRSAWRVTHPTLRRCWTQSWLMPLLDQGYAAMYDPDVVLEAFAEDEVDHVLWREFARRQIKRSIPLAGDQESWGIEANPDLMAPDLMRVRLLSIPAGGAFRSGEMDASVPLLMQYDVGPGWRLLNFLRSA
ncbi:hypothetical protein [Streptomyces sp. AK02-04a]|uniref:hypothetical protein n=1 Tax=Streptomyces sp. AK02-04a TaxID=3028649 RepID=UPI0029A40450|nr:hypothetical protein [Streptomyces sp. AK02-04a]MDX3763608.1 hypothetical protein [Streptomyces sp. AK02-04a]